MKNRATESVQSIENRVIYHALLIGASPLIPIIFLDEMLVSFLWRRMISNLAESHGLHLTKSQIAQLAIHSNPGCSSGCQAVLTYPFKEFIREILFWLEIRRGVDLAVKAYYSGILLDELFQIENFNPVLSPWYSNAISYAVRGVNQSFVRNTFQNAFRSSKDKVKGIKNQLKNYRKKLHRRGKNSRPSFATRVRILVSKPAKPLPGTVVKDEEVYQEFQNKDKEFRNILQGLVNRISKNLAQLPEEHFSQLKKLLYDRLEEELRILATRR